jgi:hypothetical protein
MIFVCFPDKSHSRIWVLKKWQPVIITGDSSILKGVTRPATNADNKRDFFKTTTTIFYQPGVFIVQLPWRLLIQLFHQAHLRYQSL